jgi:hypothetical protein
VTRIGTTARDRARLPCIAERLSWRRGVVGVACSRAIPIAWYQPVRPLDSGASAVTDAAASAEPGTTHGLLYVVPWTVRVSST